MDDDDIYADLSIYEPSEGSEYRLTDDSDYERTPARPKKRIRGSAPSRAVRECQTSDHLEEIPKYIREKCNFDLDKLPRTSTNWVLLLTGEEYQSKCSTCVERSWPCAVLSGKQTCAGCFAKHQSCNADGCASPVPEPHAAGGNPSSTAPGQQQRVTSSSKAIQSSTTVKSKTPSTSNSLADTKHHVKIKKDLACSDTSITRTERVLEKPRVEKSSHLERMSYAALGRAAADPAVARETLAEIEKELAPLLMQQQKYQQLVRMHTAEQLQKSK